MNQKIVQLKEFAYFLRVNRNDVVNRWLESEEVQEIFLKHSINFSDEDKKTFYDFFECIISVFQWSLTIAECPSKMRFLKLLSNYNVGNFEFLNLFISLKNTVSSIFYEKGFLSFGLLKDLEKVSLSVANELSVTYEQIQKDEFKSSSNNSNLLNEYKKAVDISNIVSKTNPKGIITYVNDKFCEVSGYSKKELIGKPHNIIRHPSMPSSAFKDLWDTIKQKKAWHGAITNLRKDGKKYIVDSTVIPILDIDGDIVEYIAIRHDVTEFEQTKEQLRTLNLAMKNKVDELYSITTSLEEEASTDALTGALNRNKFEHFYELEVSKAQLNKNILTMIIFDIDHFKNVNDTFGHNTGDEVLKEVAALIKNKLKRVDLFARWGGEEFVVLLPGTELEGANILAEKLRKTLEENHFSIVESVTSSFGVGAYREGETKTEFFQRVDKALYKAKRSGRNRVIAVDR